MKKVTAFVGTARKEHTYYAVQRFLEGLQAPGGVESEIVTLTDYRVERCRGCKNCFRKGEEFCPFKDDRDELMGKMLASDGVVFATPNYSYQVSSTMKAFLDRLGFVFHRPRFFGRTFTSIVAQGIYGGSKIVKYLDFVGMGLGFNVVKGSCTTALDPMNGTERSRIDAVAAEHSRRFHAGLCMKQYPVPSLLRVCAFRAARTSMRVMLDENSRDFTYYRDQGWFEADYYYPARLGILKKAAGALVDSFTARMTSGRND
ncbi:MAG: flavodoxin family protein [Nitrospiraceae bacterium]|nr:flavodoxin family protein [Nitrospiraceae bacterium]